MINKSIYYAWFQFEIPSLESVATAVGITIEQSFNH